MQAVFATVMKMLEKQEKLLERQTRTIEAIMSLPPSELDPESVNSKKRKKKATQKEKDPNKPKHPPSGYQMFIFDNKEDLKQREPNLDQKEIFTRLGNQWTELSVREKNVYLEKAALEKQDYDIRLKEYLAAKAFAAGEVVIEEKPAKKQKKRDEGEKIKKKEEKKASKKARKGKDLEGETTAALELGGEV